VVPGADGHGDVDATALQCVVLRERLFQEHVLPATDQQHWNVGAFQRIPGIPLSPERIGRLGMVEPVFPPRRARAQQRSSCLSRG
jgi:hypothetical protein